MNGFLASALKQASANKQQNKETANRNLALVLENKRKKLEDSLTQIDKSTGKKVSPFIGIGPVQPKFKISKISISSSKNPTVDENEILMIPYENFPNKLPHYIEETKFIQSNFQQNSANDSTNFHQKIPLTRLQHPTLPPFYIDKTEYKTSSNQYLKSSQSQPQQQNERAVSIPASKIQKKTSKGAQDNLKKKCEEKVVQIQKKVSMNTALIKKQQKLIELLEKKKQVGEIDPNSCKEGIKKINQNIITLSDRNSKMKKEKQLLKGWVQKEKAKNSNKKQQVVSQTTNQ